MRILYLLTDLNSGGAAQPVPDLVAVMHAQGHSVRVLALLPKDRKACARLDQAGIGWELLGQSPRDALAAARRLLKILREDRPDLIWTSLTRATIYGGIAGWLCGIPVVSWQHNSWLKKSTRRLLRLTRGLSAFWVADSHTVAAYAVKALHIAPEDIEIWPLFCARESAPVSVPWTAGKTFRIGCLARLHPSKNLRHLVAALVLLRAQQPALTTRIECVIGGIGEEQDALYAEIAAAGLSNVQLVGYVDAPQEFLASLHAYVQPSQYEGFCIAAHEAMQAALPVIATRAGELQRSVLPGETGILYSASDVPALATAIAALAGHPAHAAALGRAGRQRVLARFGVAAFAQAGAAVLRRAAALNT